MARFDSFIFAIILSALILGVIFNGLLAYFPYALTYLFVFYLGKEVYEKLEPTVNWRDYGYGISILVLSFAITPVKWIFVPGTSTFGVINYAFFLVGLTYVFFKLNMFNLNQLWKPNVLILFMAIVNFIVNYAVEDIVEAALGPTIASWIANFVRDLGYENVSNVGNIIFVREHGIKISGGCTGILGIVLYSIMSAAILIHLKLRISTKILVIMVGIYGVFAMNLLRVFLIVIIAYHNPMWIEPAHEWLGNLLFTIYLLMFWYIVLWLYDKWGHDGETVS